MQESNSDSSSVQKKMKIFNWVHRKLSNKEENVGKKNGSSASVDDDDHHHDQLWSGGILSIGTFGYDHGHDSLLLLKQADHEETYYYDDDDDDDHMTTDYNYIDSDDEEEKEESLVENHEIEVDCGEEEDACNLEVNYGYNSKREFEYVMMEKTERITLADLFSADYHHHDRQEKVLITIDNNINDNANSHYSKLAAAANGKKHVSLSSSTKIKHMVEEAPSIHKKLHHMMRRMLKRKIHPDLVVTPPTVPKSKVMEANDNASLLPTLDSAI